MTALLIGLKPANFTGSDGKKIEGSLFFFARQLFGGDGVQGYCPLSKPLYFSRKRACSLFSAEPVLLGLYDLTFDDRGRVDSISLVD